MRAYPSKYFQTTLYSEFPDPPPSVSHLIESPHFFLSPHIPPLGPSHAGGGADPTVSAGPVSRALPVHHSGQDDAACPQPAHSGNRAHWVL